jgi:putative ABC transport system substrate-binding protein
MADAQPAADLVSFRQGLAEHGWALGHNLVLAERSADGRVDRLPRLADELLALPPDALLTISTPATRAARNATATVPIICVIDGDPVSSGLVASYQRPGGNVSGITVLSAERIAKRLQLLTEMAPGTSRVAVFWRDPAAGPEARHAAQALSVQVFLVEVSDREALWRGLDAAVAWGAEALLFEPQRVVQTAMSDVAAFAAARRLPAMAGDVGFPGAGGLAAYGPPVQQSFLRAAAYVDRVLKGVKPADLPIEQPTTFEFVINLKTAQALGLTIPQHVLLQATEVLQ